MRRPTAGQVVLGIIGLAVLAAAGWRIAVALRSDETRVMLVLEDVACQTVERDYLAVLAYLDPEYRDERGLTYAEVKQIVVYYLMRAESVEVDVEPVSAVTVEADPAGGADRATVRVRARVSGKFPEGTLTLKEFYRSDDLYEIRLKRHKSYFRCTSVNAVRDTSGEGERQ